MNLRLNPHSYHTLVKFKRERKMSKRKFEELSSEEQKQFEKEQKAMEIDKVKPVETDAEKDAEDEAAAALEPFLDALQAYLDKKGITDEKEIERIVGELLVEALAEMNKKKN